MADQPPGIRLSKDERKQLLADLERDASRREPPERLLQRALAAAQAGQLDVARRLTLQLDQSAPEVAGLDYLKEQLDAAERQHKHSERLRHLGEGLLALLDGADHHVLGLAQSLRV
ncbi:MAG: hypothetical protein AAFY88_02220, partial [Acidobacteriota bacterium]